MRVAIIGGGIFGCTSALALARAGHSVVLFEKNAQIMQGASKNNHNRLHLGLHYPRSVETARQCLRGYLRFLGEFSDCVSFDFPAHYYIAAEGSLTTPGDYLRFLDEVGIPHQEVPVDDRVRGCVLGVRTWEAVYSAARLTQDLEAQLREAGVTVHLNHPAQIERTLNGFEVTNRPVDVVVNCAYDQQNSLSEQLGLIPPVRQFEYTLVPVVEITGLARQAITIMDGPFCSIQPYGFSDKFLLYHAAHAVRATSIGPMCPVWPLPTADMRQDLEAANRDWFDGVREDSARFIPALRNACVVDCLHGPRMVRANVDATDERPSVVEEPLPGYITVFSGKVDHSLWAADSVVSLLSERA